MIAAGLPARGAVLGVDVGYSQHGKTTGVCAFVCAFTANVMAGASDPERSWHPAIDSDGEVGLTA